MTIIIAFHMPHQLDFKNFYLGTIHVYHNNQFPTPLSYSRFLEVMPSVLVAPSSFFTHLKGEPTGIKFIDSTNIKVCHNLRIPKKYGIHRYSRKRQRNNGLVLCV
ncbi:hypothetical protein V4V48_004335 [Vibrio mimicus]